MNQDTVNASGKNNLNNYEQSHQSNVCLIEYFICLFEGGNIIWLKKFFVSIIFGWKIAVIRFFN